MLSSVRSRSFESLSDNPKMLHKMQVEILSNFKINFNELHAYYTYYLHVLK